MTELSWVPASLLAIRAIAHLLICIRIASYMTEKNANHRKVVGLCAGLFAGFNAAECLRIISNFQAFLINVEPYLPGIMVLVLVFVVWSGGNVAKILPRKILERLP